ncbi:MAG: stage III sporulation protein AD [Clostridiales bacterium]|nr:stage III sporulation protein AD [Clostridiales bacterium]
MWLISAVGAGLICAVLAVVLGQYRPEYRTLVSLGAGVLILMLVLENILPAVQQIESVFSLTGMDLNYGEILMKVVGICFFTQLASDVCRDAGEGSAASKIEFAGRCAVLVISLPLFTEVLELASALIK